MREQGTHWALGSLCSFPKSPAFPKSACAASLLLLSLQLWHWYQHGSAALPTAHPELAACELLARALHTAESVPLCICHPWGKCPASAHPQGWDLTLCCRAAQGVPGQVSGCPDPGLSSSGAAVPWLQPPVPQGLHPGRLLPRRLTPRQGELSTRTPQETPSLFRYLYISIF